MEKLAKIASGVLNTAIDFIIPLPSEIFIILPGIFDQFLQVFGQILRRIEVERVYVRSWRGKETIIGATVYDWDHVVPVNKRKATLFNYKFPFFPFFRERLIKKIDTYSKVKQRRRISYSFPLIFNRTEHTCSE